MGGSQEVAGVIFGCDAACVVVVTQAFSLANWPFGDEEDEWPSTVEQLHSLDVALVAVLPYPVDKPSHVGKFLRTDYQCFFGIFA